MHHLTLEYLIRKQSFVLISEITVRSGRKIVWDRKGMVHGVEFAWVNLRKSAGESFSEFREGLETLHLSQKIVRKDSHQREREDVMKQRPPMIVNQIRMVRSQKAGKQ
jgi:hypothetical protein